LNIFARFSKNLQMSNFTKICPVGTQLFHVDRQTDRKADRQTGRQAGRQAGMTKPIAAFRDFAKAPKIPMPSILLLLYII
jgi:hypothetical protein